LSTVTNAPQLRWTLRDWLAAAGLFLATTAVVLWQNAHLTVLWDMSYVLETSTRIAQGQMPYRDFPLAHAPLAFLIQAAIIRLTGRVFFHHVLYAAAMGGLGTVISWRIALNILRPRMMAAWAVALLLSVPLAVLGIYCILPLPSYDCDCALSILVALCLLQRLTPDPRPRPLRGFAAGAALCLPLFFKQNMGLPFLASAIAVILLLMGVGVFRVKHPLTPRAETAALLPVLAGVVATLMAAALLLHFTVGLGNYIHWTFQFAAQRRMPGLHDMLAVYRDPFLLWTLPSVAAALLLMRSPLIKARWAQLASFFLLASPFLFVLCSLFLYDDADERGDSLLALWPMLLVLSAAMAVFMIFKLRRSLCLRALLPLILLATINGTMLSQQLWGSTYAIWPLLILLLAEMIAFISVFNLPGILNAVPRVFAPFLAAVAAVTLLVCGGFYTASEERLSYVQLPELPARHSALPQLAGMAVSGPFLPDFEELLQFASANIPASDGLILMPGEDPFFFVTGRVPAFPVLLFDPATDPYTPAQVVEQARLHRIRWLIVKRELQINEDPTPQREATMKALLVDFTLSHQLRAYDVYRRTGGN